MANFELLLPALVLGIAIFMVILGLSNRVIAKLGLRNFFRHKGHAAISIAGLLVGTSIICASMVVGDSIEYYIVEETYNELGQVDIVVTGGWGTSFDQSIHERLEADANVSGMTDAISPIYFSSVSVRNSASNLFEPSVNMMGFDAGMDRGFGDFFSDDGTAFDGAGLSPDGAIINRELADELGASIGDELKVTYSLGQMSDGIRNITIEHIASDSGKARYSPEFEVGAGKFNMFLRLDTVQEMFQDPGMITHIKISNLGNIEEGVKLSDDVVPEIQRVLSGIAFPADEGQVSWSDRNATLGHRNVKADTIVLEVNGVAVPAGDYELNDEAGHVLFFQPLQPGDTLSASYEYYYPLKADATKQDALNMAKRINDVVSTFLTIFGSFAIIAGVILIINIFTMLAEERKSEMGMARAVGMKRRHLMRAFLFEGLAYGSIASAMGVIVGLGVGYVLIYLVNELMSFINVRLPFHFELFSLAEAFSLGFIITFATILLTSWKISRLNIIQAIRGIDEPKDKRKGILMILFGGLMVAASAFAYINHPDDALAILLGPSGIVTGAALMLRRWIGDRVSIIVASLFTFIYTLYAIRTSLSEMTDQMEVVFILSGVIIVLSIVLLIMYNSKPVILAITNTFGRVRRFRPTVMTAVSYPLTKKFRTGMSVAMFALVIYMIVMLSVFSGMFTVDVERETLKQGGGYDIIGEFNNPRMSVPDIRYATYPGTADIIASDTLLNNLTADIAQLSRSYAINTNVTDKKAAHGFMGFDMDFDMPTVIYGIDENFYEKGHREFSQRLEAYPEDNDVWEAVMDPGSNRTVIDTRMSMILQAEPGNHVIFTTYEGDLTREFEVIAIMDQVMLNGFFMSKQNAYGDFGPLAMANAVFLFELGENMDTLGTANGIERDFSSRGMNTVIIRDMVELSMETTNSLFVLFELYLDMGLVVGVAGLGIITIRSVVERTPEIGILRSLGFKRKNVRNAFLIEILFIATLGVVIGIFTGVIVSHEIFNIIVKDYTQNIEFAVPWLRIAYVTAIAYAATIVCTIIPARNASKISPAEALRYVG